MLWSPVFLHPLNEFGLGFVLWVFVGGGVCPFFLIP